MNNGQCVCLCHSGCFVNFVCDCKNGYSYVYKIAPNISERLEKLESLIVIDRIENACLKAQKHMRPY